MAFKIGTLRADECSACGFLSLSYAKSALAFLLSTMI